MCAKVLPHWKNRYSVVTTVVNEPYAVHNEMSKNLTIVIISMGETEKANMHR